MDRINSYYICKNKNEILRSKYRCPQCCRWWFSFFSGDDKQTCRSCGCKVESEESKRYVRLQDTLADADLGPGRRRMEPQDIGRFFN